jgi:hypothetical protein
MTDLTDKQIIEALSGKPENDSVKEQVDDMVNSLIGPADGAGEK